VDGLFISSPAFSPNTDGIHVENTKSVQIHNSRINNGAYAVSVRTLFTTSTVLVPSPDP
jgi:polygalacturonase